MDIHPSAVVDAQAELATDVVIRPHCVIGPHVSIGSGSVIGPHVVIDGWTAIGAGNRIYPFTSIGHAPQDLSYAGEETRVVIGNNNIIREYVSIHRGTPRGGGTTRIGNNNYIMTSVHIAHDCVLGDFVIMASGAVLGGHVHIDDHAIVGGLVAVHQFVRIGTCAYIGGLSGVAQDVPPYTLIAGEHARLRGLNLVGLKRRELPVKTVQALKKAYKILFRSNHMLRDAIQEVRDELESLPEIDNLLHFVEQESNRGITR